MCWFGAREEDRTSADDIRGLIINPGSNQPVTLESICGYSRCYRSERNSACITTTGRIGYGQLNYGDLRHGC
ncbi:MAG: hypothetical protein U5K69_24260 [Balneolaceae bacterium]|nr:hypothetical protein [Balneolaceae bacterium]